MVISVWVWAKDQAMLEQAARSSKTLVDDFLLIKIIWVISIETGIDVGISIMQDVSRGRCVFYTSLYVCMSLYRCALYVYGWVVLN